MPGFAPEVIIATVAKEYHAHDNPGEQSCVGPGSACGHQQTNVQLYTQQVTGFSGYSQPCLPVLACPFLLSRYSYRYRYIGSRISGYLNLWRGKAYPAIIGEFSPPFFSILFQRRKGGDGKNMSYLVLIVNGQFELRCLSRGQVIDFYPGGGDTEVNVLGQSKRGEEDDQ